MPGQPDDLLSITSNGYSHFKFPVEVKVKGLDKQMKTVASWWSGGPWRSEGTPAFEMVLGEEDALAFKKRREKLIISAAPQPPYIYYDETEGVRNSVLCLIIN